MNYKSYCKVNSDSVYVITYNNIQGFFLDKPSGLKLFRKLLLCDSISKINFYMIKNDSSFKAKIKSLEEKNIYKEQENSLLKGQVKIERDNVSLEKKKAKIDNRNIKIEARISQILLIFSFIKFVFIK